MTALAPAAPVTAETLHQWRDHVVTTSGYISADNLIEAEIGFNEDVNAFQWYVALYHDRTHAFIRNHAGGTADTKTLCYEKADEWITRFEAVLHAD